MKLTIVLSFFFCGFLFLLKTGKRFDSFGLSNPTAIGKQTPQDSLKTIEANVRAFARQKKYDSAIIYSRKLFHRALLDSDSTYMANANRRLGFYFKKKSKLDSSFFYFNESLKISLKIKDSAQSAMQLLDMANIQNSLGDFSGSKITAIDGLSFLNADSKNSIASGLNHIISVSAYEQEDYDEALKWNKRAIEIGAVDSWNTLIFQNTKANILAGQGRYDTSVAILNRLLKDSLVVNNPNEFARIQCNLGSILNKKNGYNRQTEELLTNSLNIRKQHNAVSGLIVGNLNLARFYYDKNPTKALDYAMEALKNANQLKNPVSILEALDIIIPLKTELNIEVGKEAVLYSEVQNDLESTQQNIRRIYAATKYDNDKLSQDNLILKAETARKEKQNTLYLTAFLLSLSLVGFIIYYKNSQKKRAKFEASYRAEIRVAKKIHDELGNDIFYLMTQIDSSTDIIEEQSRNRLKELVNTIYLKARDINKEYTPIDTGDSYGNQLIAMLNSYQNETTRIVTKEFTEDFWNAVAPEKKIELFRVLRELFTNMKKHSKATFVGITFTKENRSMVVKYIDNDIAFDIKNLVKGDGLTNVENRINGINGTINFDKEPNLGLKVIIQFLI